MNNLFNKLTNFFVSQIEDLKDIKEKNRLALLEEFKMDLNVLQELKSSCDMFDETLNSQAYHMYTFMEDTKKEELKAYLMPKFVHVIDKYHDLEKVFFLINKLEENLNKLIKMLNNKEENNSEFKEFSENVTSEINTLQIMFTNLEMDKEAKEFIEISELMLKNY